MKQPEEAIKALIDKLFIKDITEDLENTAIVKTIIDLAKSMGLTVLTEGVETREQLEILKQHGCDECRGICLANLLKKTIRLNKLAND